MPMFTNFSSPYQLCLSLARSERQVPPFRLGSPSYLFSIFEAANLFFRLLRQKKNLAAAAPTTKASSKRRRGGAWGLLVWESFYASHLESYWFLKIRNHGSFQKKVKITSRGLENLSIFLVFQTPKFFNFHCHYLPTLGSSGFKSDPTLLSFGRWSENPFRGKRRMDGKWIDGRLDVSPGSKRKLPYSSGENQQGFSLRESWEISSMNGA